MLPDKLGKARPLGEQSRLSGKKLSKSKSLDKDRQIKIKVLCDHSEELPEKYFNNKVAAKDLASDIRTQITEILRLDGKNVLASKIPLKTENALEKNKNDKDRVENILSLYNFHFEEDMITKCTYKTHVDYKVKGDLLRVFVKQEDNILSIILIDPHHLVATDDYQNIYRQRKNKFKFCFSCLKNISIFN